MTWRAAAVLLVLPAVAAAQDGTAALRELDRAGRALAAAPCPRPAETKVTRGSGGDELRSIDCRGWKVAVVVSNRGGSERIAPLALVVTNGGVMAAWPGGVGPGAAAAEVPSHYGPPTQRRGEALAYRLDPTQPGGDTVIFEIDAGVVRAVAWSWDAD